jgi:hypothetical protein
MLMFLVWNAGSGGAVLQVIHGHSQMTELNRLSQRACQNGLPRLAEFEFGCAGLDGLAYGWA